MLYEGGNGQVFLITKINHQWTGFLNYGNKSSMLYLKGIELNTKELPNCETHLNAMCVQMNTRKKQDMLDWN